MPHLTNIQSIYARIALQIENPKIWAICSAIGLFVSQYIFSQWAFALGFFIIFIMDTVSGSYVAWRKAKFSGKVFRDKLMDKSVAYFTIIIAFSASTKILLEDSDYNMIRYLNVPFYTLFIVVELRSVVAKWYNYTKWPWLARLIEIVDSIPGKQQKT